MLLWIGLFMGPSISRILFWLKPGKRRDGLACDSRSARGRAACGRPPRGRPAGLRPGPPRPALQNFAGLVLGCIEAKVLQKIDKKLRLQNCAKEFMM